jgi:uncharacterized membrane protein
MERSTHSETVAAPAVPGFGGWVLLLTVCALALRLVRLGAQSIWIDEGMSIGWIAEIQQRGWGTLRHDLHGPLYTAVLYAASRVSMQEAWLRLPSALAGAAAVPALAHLGRRLGGERVALTAALLLVVSPFALYYSQEVRNYAFTLVFASLTCAAAWEAARRPSVRTLLGFVFCAILGMLSNLNGAFLALGLNAWLLWVWRRDRRLLLRWLGVHALAGVLLVPYAWQVQQRVHAERMVGVETDFGTKEPLRGGTTLHAMSLPYTGYAFAAGYSLGPTLEELRRDPRAVWSWRHLPALGLVLLGFGVPLAACALRLREWNAAGLLLAATVVVAGLTLWLGAANVKPFNARYLSVLLPLYLLAVGRGLWVLPRPVGWLAASAAVVVSLWSSANYLFVPRYGRDDTRGVVEYLRAHAGPEDLVLHINLGFSLNYYDRLTQVVRLAEPGSGDSPEAARRYLDRIVEGCPVLWYLECRPEKLDPHGYLRQACAERAISGSTLQFVGIRVHRFQLR